MSGATSILSILYGILALTGLMLLAVSTDAGNITDVIVGVGALVLGVLGVEAQSIIMSIEKSLAGAQ